jgi:cytochrome c-type biogenesis protein CcsB
MTVAILVFAFAMAIATFIENDYGTPTAKALIYNTKWFEAIMLLLTINFIGNIFRYRLYRKEKWAVLLFHIGFIIIIMGAFLTRYLGYEGVMMIREGELSNTIYSDKNYIFTRIDDGKVMKKYEDAVLFSQIGNNKYKLKDDFGIETKKPFSVKLTKYIANKKQVFVPDEKGENYIHIVESTIGGRNDKFLKEGNAITINNIIFTYNKPIKGAMNIIVTDKDTTLQTMIDGKFMNMQTRNFTEIKKDSVSPLQIAKLYSFDKMNFVIKDFEKGRIVTQTANNDEKDKYPYDALIFEVSSGNETKSVEVMGASGVIESPKRVSVNGLNFIIRYGAKEIKTPFSVKLRDFQLEHYPGTNSPSSYASEVTVYDKDKTFDYRIFMNNVLDYKGYRFFQSSYDPDEKGTVLSVNHDKPGTLLTYIGYFLMGLGMFFTLFLKGSRFKDLSQKLNKISKNKFAIVAFLLFYIGTFSQDNHNHPSDKAKVDVSKFSVNKEHAKKFGKLLILDFQGRVKPVNTYALEALRKVYKKDKYKGLTAEQVLLSAQVNPSLWSRESIIKTSSVKLGSKLSNKLNVKNDYLTLIDLLPDGRYALEKDVAESFRKKNINRNEVDKEVINLDERVNILLNILSGQALTIYPKRNDPIKKWYSGFDDKAFVEQDTMVLKMHKLYLSALSKGVATGNYGDADQYLDIISQYQKKIGADIIPEQKKIDLEIAYNKWNIFKKLMFYYMIFGFILLILTFIDLFNPNKKTVNVLIKVNMFFVIIGMLAHLAGMGARWFITGHEPWSNGYEAVVFVAFITTFAGLVFSKNRSTFIIASTTLFASFLLAIAHGSMMSPEMTNLVPVLKSYWLMIHVAVITASYGFLGLSALLGFIVLLLYILRNTKNAKQLNETIKELTYVNESSMIVGLFMLSIGTFLGGVWANESWGRYWSWDPKEVWALISMMVYTFILHIRLVPGLQSRFTFNFLGMISISTLIMTFFGVNYYLSGMHSYAKGDPVPIPSWIYWFIGFIMMFSVASYKRYLSFKKK